MALKKTITTASGITVENAYHRIENVVHLGKTAIEFKIRSYVDPSLMPFDERAFSCAYDIDGQNVYAQAYSAVKSALMPGAVDC